MQFGPRKYEYDDIGNRCSVVDETTDSDSYEINRNGSEKIQAKGKKVKGNGVQKLPFIIALIFSCCALAVAFGASFVIGRYNNIGIGKVLGVLFKQIFPSIETTWTPIEEAVVLKLRLPRIISSCFVGAALSVSGLAFQMLFSNPMASADTLGVSSGSGLGACFGILIGVGTYMISIFAFIIGCATVLLTYIIAMSISRGKNATIFLVLTGLVISAFASSIISIIKYIADPQDQLPEIVYWLMGSFASVKITSFYIFLICFLIGIVPIALLSWKINILSVSDIEAKSMGVNINLLRTITIVCATLLTSSSIAIAGGIGWVGLVIPHISRLIAGNDFRKTLPLSAVIGALYLLIMDDLARSISAGEIPIGILTALIGAPVFFAILIKQRKRLAL